MDKIIFLDIDGVLNHQKMYDRINWKDREHFRDDYGELFCPVSSLLLNELIIKTNAQIVISSSWRLEGLEVMKNMWKDRKMNGKIIGITPYSKLRFRGLEIEDWLAKERGFYYYPWSKENTLEYLIASNISNFIIIDDDSDMTYNQRNNFIHVKQPPDNYSGFNKKYFNKALKILNSSFVEINF